MKALLITFCSLFLSVNVFAHKKDHHHHHDHHEKENQALGSHVHGEVEVSLVSSAKQLAVQLTGPAESFIGFEYEAKTEEEKQKIVTLKEQWNKNLFEMISFTAGVCKATGTSLKLSSIIDHSTVNAEAVLECPFELSGQSLTIKLRELFPRIEVLKIEALPENKSPVVKELKGETKTVGIEF